MLQNLWRKRMYKEGRQGTGYLVKTLLSKVILGLGIDVHVIKYPTGSYIPEHVDTVDGKRHYRLNIVLQKANIGGIFVKNGEWQQGRIYFFRPDVDKHSVVRIHSGTRKVLSIGIAF